MTDRLSLRSLLLVSSLIVLTCLSACGGNDDTVADAGTQGTPAASAPPASPPPVSQNPPPATETPPTTETPPAQQPPSVSGQLAALSRAVDNVGAKYEELLKANTPQPMKALAEYMRTQPEFVEAGYESGSAAWGRLANGRYFAYVDDWKVPPKSLPAPANEARVAAKLAATKAPAKADAPAKEVPASRRAVLLGLVKDPDFSHGLGTLDRMKDALEMHGWNVNAPGTNRTNQAITVEALRDIKNVGFLYLNTHATFYGPDPLGVGSSFAQKQYAILTDTFSKDEPDLATESDLNDGSLIYTRTRSWYLTFSRNNDYYLSGGLYAPPHYAVTQKFIRKHWSFANNSLSILMMCNSGTSAGSDIVAAVREKNGGTVIAWDGFANPRGYAMVDVLVDRLAGANKDIPIAQAGTFKAPDVPGRAFEFDDVWAFLEEKGLLHQTGSDADHPDATMVRRGEGFSMLSPVAKVVQNLGTMHGGNNRVFITGAFGTRQGTVEIGGVQRPVAAWTKDTVEVDTDAADGPGSTGEIVVTVDGLKSNKRSLGAWTGKVIYTNDVGASGKVEVTHELHVRGDQHATRDKVDGPLQGAGVDLGVSNTKVTWAASGSPSSSTHWSGAGTTPLEFDVSNFSTYNAAIVTMEPNLNRFSVLLSLHDDHTETYDGVPPNVHKRTFVLLPERQGGPSGTRFTFASSTDQSVPAGSFVYVEPTNDSQWKNSWTTKWGGIQSMTPYDPKIGR